MQTIEESIDVHVPIQAAYDQWQRFEEFPEFMEDVDEVRDLGGNNLHWIVSIANKRHEWDAEITENIPSQRISWRSTSGKPNHGTVLFREAGEHVTRITFQLTYEPEGLLERMADAVGLVKSRVQRDLEQFKQFIENKQQEVGSRQTNASAGSASKVASVPRSKRLNEELAKQFTNVTPSTTPSGTPGKM